MKNNEIKMATYMDWKQLDLQIHTGFAKAIAYAKDNLKSMIIPTNPSVIKVIDYYKTMSLYDDLFIDDTSSQEYWIHVEEDAESINKVDVKLIVSTLVKSKIYAKKMTIHQECCNIFPGLINNEKMISILEKYYCSQNPYYFAEEDNSDPPPQIDNEPKPTNSKSENISPVLKGKKRNYKSLTKEEKDDIVSMILNKATDEDLINKYNLHHFTIKKFRLKLADVKTVPNSQPQLNLQPVKEQTWADLSQHLKAQIIDGLIKLSARGLVKDPKQTDKFSDYFKISTDVLVQAFNSNKTLITMKSSNLLKQVSNKMDSPLLQLPYEMDTQTAKETVTTLTPDDLKKLADYFNNN